MGLAAHTGNAESVGQETAKAIGCAGRVRAAEDFEGHDFGITKLSAPYHAGTYPQPGSSLTCLLSHAS